MDIADWLGHLMAGWPAWLIGVVVVVFIVIGALWLFFWSAEEGMTPHTWRRKHGKK